MTHPMNRMSTSQAYATYVEQLTPRVGQAAPMTLEDRMGFTAPARIWAKVDDIERSAASLDRDVDMNVREPGFVAGWKTWYANWRRNYYDKYRSSSLDSVKNRLGALSGSDQLDAEVEAQRKTLHDFYENYTRQRLPNGQPVPFPSGLPPSRFGTDDPQTQSAWTLPWWFWLAAGSALAFIAWRFYVTYKKVDARGRAIEDRLVPALAARTGLPEQETREVLQAGRDVPSPALNPLNLAFYAQADAARSAWENAPAPNRMGQPARNYARSPFDMDDASYDDGYEDSNFAYDPSRDPLRDRFR